jgi:hypothetical protein
MAVEIEGDLIKDASKFISILIVLINKAGGSIRVKSSDFDEIDINDYLICRPNDDNSVDLMLQSYLEKRRI